MRTNREDKMDRAFQSRAISFLFVLTYLIVTNCFSQDEAPTAESTPSWEDIRAFKMKGELKAFWNVGGRDRKNREYSTSEAVKHGFLLVDLLGTYADYPGRQKENIRKFLEHTNNRTNPWNKPPFFEKIIRRNIAGRGGNAIFVHDIEFPLETDIEKAWADEAAREASGISKKQDFAAAYFREWASWYALPCMWTKEIHPQEPVGIYGRQPFQRDYWGFVKNTPQELAQAHATDERIWRHIDPYVDFYIASIYVFYDKPGSVYYMAANVEENVKRARRLGRKPVYAYVWLRYHNSNKKIGGQELDPFLVEAMAVIPYFCGAKGLVLWGWEPEGKGQYYHKLPLFMDSLGRVADLSEKISKAELVIEEAAHVLWREKRPLVRKFEVTENEWIVMATNPWQEPDAVTTIKVKCGRKSVKLAIHGRHTEIYHLEKDRLKRIPVGEQ